MNKDIILFGMQGSGKGTQGKILLETLKNHKYLEMGQIFRALGSNDNAIGNYAKARVNQGLLVEDKVTIALFNAFYNTLEESDYMMTDGYPRKPEQAQHFLNTLQNNNREFVSVYFDLPKDVAVERILKRAQEQGRVDDTPEKIETRIQLYLDETMPIINMFKERGEFINIDATQTIDEIAAELKEKLGL